MAVERGRTLLVLDTAVEDGASGLYEALGFQLTGVIPGLCLKAAWRADRHDDLLEAHRRERASGSSGQPAAIARKSAAFRLAPPTSAPLTLATAINSAALEGFTEPP